MGKIVLEFLIKCECGYSLVICNNALHCVNAKAAKLHVSQFAAIYHAAFF